MFDFFKHFKKIVVGCVILTIIRLICSIHIGQSKVLKLSVYHEHPELGTYFVHPSEDNNSGGGKSVDLNNNDLIRNNVFHINSYDYANLSAVADQEHELMMSFNHTVRNDYEDKFNGKLRDFLAKLMNIIDHCNPGIPDINNDEHYRESANGNIFPNKRGRIPVYGGHLRENYLSEPVRTKEMLSNFLRLTEEEKEILAQSHVKFLHDMPTMIPEDLIAFSKFNKFMKNDGIVYLGGDDYNQLALLSIQLLRETGSKLPVELIVPRESDYDIDLCQNILPNYNAQCKIMSHYLPKEITDKVQGYQLKNLALIISSFQRVLYLDADNIPIKNPDFLFCNEPFTSKHLVIWPDLWRRSTSPLFYDISHIDVSLENRVRNSYFKNDKRQGSYSYHDLQGTIPEASSETGQILINKSVHFRTLILSMYYNYYGPNFYYALLSQGAAGEGDKETFIAAAHRLGLPYYQVNEFNREFGPLKAKDKHEFFGMGQYDPVIDYLQSKHKDIFGQDDYDHDYAIDELDVEHLNYNFHYFKSSSLMFLHSNWPKFKLHEMFILNSYGRGPVTGIKRRRLYEFNLITEAKSDFELIIFQNLNKLYCELHINLRGIPDFDSEERKKICTEIANHISFLSVPPPNPSPPSLSSPT